MDTDGSDRTDVPIKCTVTIEDEAIHVDFAGSAPAGPHGLNESYGCLQAAGSIPVMMVIDPDIPHNDGCLRCVTVSAPLGSVCNAEHPASTAQSTTVPSDLMQDIVCKALAQAIPDRIRAGGPHWSTAPMVSGVDTRTGRFFGHLAMNGGGGGPAANGADGWPLITCLAGFGGLKAAPVEYTELLNPFAVDFCEAETDSMGLGEYIGGPGIRWSLRPLHGPIEVMSCGDGITNPPYGVGGGTPGDGGGSYIESCVDPRAPRRFMHSQLVPMQVAEGERWVGVSPGGGGWGDPLKRPVSQVVEDVRDGLYSAAAAREVFGVVFGDTAEGELDAVATDGRRAELRATRGVDPTGTNPTEPRTCDWFDRNMRDDDVFITPMAWEGSRPVAHSTNEWARPLDPRRHPMRAIPGY
jgi:N-methylhydantoinase B